MDLREPTLDVIEESGGGAIGGGAGGGAGTGSKVWSPTLFFRLVYVKKTLILCAPDGSSSMNPHLLCKDTTYIVFCLRP